MDTGWPFIGRTEQMDELCAELRTPDGRGIVIVGPAGTGKSRLADEAVSRLPPESFVVARIVATMAGSAIPFAALAHLLPAGSPPANASANPIRWATEAIRSGTGGRRLILHVDDAHFLDPVSAVLVHHLVVHGTARLLATVRSDRSTPEPVAALWQKELVPRLDIDQLTAEEVAAVLSEVLGGPVEHAGAHRMWTVSQGNFLFLRELVRDGLRTKTLCEARGVWRWQGDTPIGTRLGDLIADRLAEAAPLQHELVELLAFGEPLGVTLLDALTAPGAVADAEAHGLVTTLSSDRRLQARLSHPLYGQAVRDRMGSPLRARQVLRRLIAATEATGRRRSGDILRIALWRLDSSESCDPEQLLAAGSLAWAAHDADTAIRLGRAAVAAGGGVEAELFLAGVLHFTDHPEQAQSILRAARTDARTEADRNRCAILQALNLNWGLGEEEQAMKLLEDIDAHSPDPAWRQRALVQKALFHSAGLRCVQGLEAIAAARTLGPLERDSAVKVSYTEVLALTHLGTPAKAFALGRAALAASEADREDLPEILRILEFFTGTAALCAGDLDSAAEFGTRGYRWVEGTGAWNHHGAALFGVLQAQTCRLRGDVADAVRWARDGGAGLDGPSSGLANWCLAELAHAAALAGDVGTARQALAEAEACALDIARVGHFTTAFARTWVLAAEGGIKAAITSTLATAVEAAGLPGMRLHALHDAVRLGAAHRALPELRALAGEMDGLLAPLYLRHAEAAAAQDGPALTAAADSFEALGMRLHAAEAAAQAAVLFHARGHRTDAYRAASRSRALARGCQGARTPALHRLSAPDLTPRQLEIAELVVAGLTNRQIADRLTISVRTVDNHLYAVYTRLGVDTRRDLARLINGR